ncbi:MAG: hypothetical protein WC700_02175 [Gemmatimonadaceae bacterium]|jgi:hypothetical protein
MFPFSLSENMKIVELLAPAADAGGRTSDYISLKNYIKAFIVVHITQGNAATIALTPKQATAVAGTAVKVLANAVRIWSDLDTAASDTLVARTAAVDYTTDAGVKNKIVVFEIDPETLDVAGGFDCITVLTGASNVANITQAMAYLVPRYAQATPPSAIVD